MHTFLDNFQKGEKYSTQIAIYQAELMIEKNFIDETSLSISAFQTD